MNPRVALPALLLCMLVTPARGDSADAVLDALHAAGAAADSAGFFAHMLPDAAVLGVDGTGLLQGAALRSHFEGRFSAGDAWNYRSTGRSLRYSAERDTAWFTESLTSPGGGHNWGSGVLTRTAAGWKLALYSLVAAVGAAGAGPVSPPAGIGADGAGSAGRSQEQKVAPGQEEGEAATAERQEKKPCRRLRHKTNKASSC